MSRVLAVLSLLCLLFASPALAGNGPAISFENTEIHFTDVKEGKILRAKFNFTNKGDQNLIIDKVSPSCGCTVPHFNKVTKPGEKGYIELVVDTKGFSGMFRKTAVVSSNDPLNPFATVVVTGETRALIKIDKGRRIELSGCLGQTISTTATLSHPEGKVLFLRGLENPMRSYLSAELKPVPGGKNYTLKVTATTQKAAEFAGPLYIRTAKGPKVQVWVYANVKGAMSVVPRSVYFGSVPKEAGPGWSRTVHVKRECSDKLEIEGLVFNSARYKVEKAWKVPGDHMVITLQPIGAGFKKGAFDDELIIKVKGQSPVVVRLKGVSQ